MSDGSATSASAGWPGPLQWHYDLHRVWARGSLRFWLLRFAEGYEREEMFDQIEDLMREAGVGAYASYEISGEFDILLRAWIPLEQTGRFPELIDERLLLHPEDDQREYVAVEIVRQWIWSEEGSTVFTPRACDLEALQKNTTLEEIEIVNRLSDESHGQLAPQPDAVNPELPQRMMEELAIADLQATTGIRVLIRISPRENLRKPDRLKMTTMIASELDRMTRPKGFEFEVGEGRFLVDEASLYRCKDHSLLLLCRLPYVAWHSMREELLDPLGRVPGVSQTTTYPALSQGFVRSREFLFLGEEIPGLLRGGADRPTEDAERSDGEVPPPPPVLPGVLDFLDRPEDEGFEAKGSAFTPLDGWLRREFDAPDDKHLKESSGFFRDTVARNVVAMLNSGGGVIVIGLLEVDRYQDHSSDRLRLRLSKLPRGGRFHVIGLQDPIFQSGGWDKFELKLNRLLTEQIDGEIVDLVHVSRDWYQERTLAVIRVDYPGMSEGFFLREGRESRFLVRNGGSTEELRGSRASRYIGRRRNREQRGWRRSE